jgi:DNA-directed RNA polymerase subunit beta
MPTITPVLTDAPTLRARIHEKMLAALGSAFPVDLKGNSLELKDARVLAKNYTPAEQHRAIMAGESLEEMIKGTLVLRGPGGVVDEAKNFTLTHLPYLTERHTLILDGNEYQIANMLRRRPGVYTQRSENGELHTAFNLQKGMNFDLSFHPEKGTLFLTYQNTNVPLYPVLRALGVPHEDISKHWSAGVADANRTAFEKKGEPAVAKLYQKLIHPALQVPTASHEARVDAIRAKYDATALDPDVTEHTLGERHSKVTTPLLLRAARQILDVHNGRAEVDDVDSLAFKTFHSIDDFLAERTKLSARDWNMKARLALRGKTKIREALTPAPFTRPLRRWLGETPLMAVPTGINPMELIDHATKVTLLGEGGIPSERAIPRDARMTHATHYGTLDAIRTPESGMAGVDIRATIAAHRDEHGNLYTPVVNARSGKHEFLRAGDLLKHVVAFPHQELKGQVDAFVKGEVSRVSASKVDYQIPHGANALSPVTSLIPLLHNIQGNRAIMGSKMQTQALPLLAREAPLVQVASHIPGQAFEQLYGKLIVPISPVAGRVARIADGLIHIEPDAPAKHAAAKEETAVPFQTHFPFPSKTYLHHDLQVQVGDRVAAGQVLAGSNYTTPDATLALGTNLRVAYVPYHGLNSNDAVVISEGAAQKLTSTHAYREVFPLRPSISLSKVKHRTWFGAKYQPGQLAHLDEDGVVKKGAKVSTGDVLIAGLSENVVRGQDALLGRISKTLTRPYQEHALHWTHGTSGEVIDVVRTPTRVSVLVKTSEPMQIGDKLSNRYGGKGVVAKIVPDHEMLRDEHNNPIDLLMTSTGVISRINPAQIIETAVSKVADKTGKPIVYDNAVQHDAVAWAKGLLAKHGLKDKEIVYDPLNKRSLKGLDGKGVLVGKQYIFKLFKSTDTNFSGHAVGPYDVNEQPLKTGGEESAKAIGRMEFDALLAHNARGILHEAATIRGQKNDEFWRAVQLGLPLPTPKPSFAWNKFVAMLEGAGVKVDKRNSRVRLLPATDKDVLARSTGAIQNNKTLVAKSLAPEPGGLFDPRLTGGPQGTLYAHIDLHEPVPNPMFFDPTRRLLGMTEKELTNAISDHGGSWVRDRLAAIHVEPKIKDLRTQLKTTRGAELNNVVKQIKALENLHREGLKPQDAYVISKVPVIPPMFRPITAMPNDPSSLMIADANKLYGHLMDVNDALKKTVLPSDIPKNRGALFKAVSAVFGTGETEDEELRGQRVKGFISSIAGRGSPKGGFFQRKLMFRTQDVSGRGTAAPDGSLGMDQVGIPEEMLWKMLDRLLIARLVRGGYPALQARQLVDRRQPAAKAALMEEIRDRPVLINRAPTLHRWNIMAAYPVPVQGKTIRVNSFIEKGQNLDYDGDTLQIHVPVTLEGVADAKRMTLPNLLLSDQTHNRLVAFPQHEAILGIAHASAAAPDTSKETRTFKSRDELLSAYRKGELKLTDPVKIAS